MDQKPINPETLFKLEDPRKDGARSAEQPSNSRVALTHADIATAVDGMVEGGSERVSEQKEPASEQKGIGHVQSQTQGVAKQVQTAAIKAQLLAALPAERVMKQQIEGVLSHQIDHLMKSAKKAEKRDDYFELNRIVALIRSLKDTLADLAYATYEMLKNLWLKVVHGLE
ncbi:hypothetical protein HZA41_01920 [Candidatus Peregrinibacteria bacterium]|nr:hypothetical protein [Candidatus Peregrinibacteria bacterium]